LQSGHSQAHIARAIGVDPSTISRARNLGEDRFIGLEYYAGLGTPGNWQSFQQQSHQLFAVTDFKVGEIDADLGIGYGLTKGSDLWIAKAILSYAFPVPGKKSEDSSRHEDTARLALDVQPNARAGGP
jgi:hypothetical protein